MKEIRYKCDKCGTYTDDLKTCDKGHILIEDSMFKYAYFSELRWWRTIKVFNIASHASSYLHFCNIKCMAEYMGERYREVALSVRGADAGTLIDE